MEVLQKLPKHMRDYINSITNYHKKMWTVEAATLLVNTYGYPEHENSHRFAYGFIEGYITVKALDYNPIKLFE